MLAGEPPFTGPTAQAIVAKVITEKPPSLTARRETVPPEVEDAVIGARQAPGRPVRQRCGVRQRPHTGRTHDGHTADGTRRREGCGYEASLVRRARWRRGVRRAGRRPVVEYQPTRANGRRRAAGAALVHRASGHPGALAGRRVPVLRRADLPPRRRPVPVRAAGSGDRHQPPGAGAAGRPADRRRALDARWDVAGAGRRPRRSRRRPLRATAPGRDGAADRRRGSVRHLRRRRLRPGYGDRQKADHPARGVAGVGCDRRYARPPRGS